MEKNLENKNASKWYERTDKNIQTHSQEKREIPYGMWHNCSRCKTISDFEDFVGNLYTCPKCFRHERINSEEYFKILFDGGKHKLVFEDITSHDPLKFVDRKKYTDRIAQATEKTPYTEAVSIGVGALDKKELVIACMNFSFIGGSMGSAVGERISKGIDYAIKQKLPFMVISKSGGARMMESAFSLMQMAKTSAKLTLLDKEKLPYICLLTDPTTGGVTASFAMLGDIILAEPEALIGFAGPVVIKETTQQDLPEGFQRSEKVLETGFIDKIVKRQDLKKTISQFLTFLKD